jgi:hypothetical protein
MHNPVLRRFAVGLAAPAVLVLGLAACGAGDASRSDVQDELEEGGLTEAQAECVTDRIFDELDQDEINELYEADEGDDPPDGVEETFTTAATECASE